MSDRSEAGSRQLVLKAIQEQPYYLNKERDLCLKPVIDKVAGKFASSEYEDRKEAVSPAIDQLPVWMDSLPTQPEAIFQGGRTPWQRHWSYTSIRLLGWSLPKRCWKSCPSCLVSILLVTTKSQWVVVILSRSRTSVTAISAWNKTVDESMMILIEHWGSKGLQDVITKVLAGVGATVPSGQSAEAKQVMQEALRVCSKLSTYVGLEKELTMMSAKTYPSPVWTNKEAPLRAM